jgi:hypothetical protein
LKALKKLSRSKNKVLREGKIVEILGEDVTVEDIVYLNAGDIIKAVSSAASGLVCLYSVYEGSSAPVATGFTGRGVWSSGSTYAVNDIVTTNAGTYLALQASTNQDPATETAYWMFLQGVSASALPSQSGQTVAVAR